MIAKLFAAALFCALMSVLSLQTSAESGAARYPAVQNERFAIRAMRELAAAQYTFSATEGNGNFGTFADLGRLGLIDSRLATGCKSGYLFVMQTTDGFLNYPATFSIKATPFSYRKTGRKSFYLDNLGTLRGADKNGAMATSDDPLIENECLPNEECAISNLRTLYSAEITYQATSGNGSHGTLNQLFAAGLINELLARGYANGYNFNVTSTVRTTTSQASFKVTAVPINYGITGIRSFYMDESGVIRAADRHGELATADDPPLE